MKYKTKIAPKDGGYVGYVLLGEEVVFTSNNHRDTIMVARELSSYIAESQTAPSAPVQRRANSSVQAPVTNNLVPVTRSVSQQPQQQSSPASVPPTPPAPVPRRCCGRG